MKVVGQLALEKPERITTTKCRKYAATITQLLDLSKNEQEWLANHLGHSLDIEKQFYRIHESLFPDCLYLPVAFCRICVASP